MEWIVTARKIAAELLSGIRRAACLLTGAKRRCFQAEIATEYCNASPRQTEAWFGFNRHAVKRGLLEKETGKTLRKTPERRGRPKVEDKLPQLAQLTDQALSETAQMDPKFQTTIAYTRVTGKQLRESFAQALGIAVDKLPVARTLRRLMNRRNFSLRRVRKTQPLKKIKQTDAILDNVKQAHQRAADDPSILRISIDNKAKVNYYPPYHSKYNALERCWGALEKHWNGTLLTTIPIVLKWAQSMTWKGIRPIVRTLDGVYRRGVKLNKSEYAPIAARLQRTESIEKWSVTISPQLLPAP